MNERLAKLLKSPEIKGLKKTYKGAEIASAAQLRDAGLTNDAMLSTGNYALDVALGGGLRSGRFHTFYGPPSSGKTHAVLTTIAQAQRSCSRCWLELDECACKEDPRPAVPMLILTEDWDEQWARHVGVNIDELVLSLPTTGEEALDEIDVLMRTGHVDLIALDSVAMVTPSKEIEHSVAKDHMAIAARMIGKAVRKTQAGIQILRRQGIFPTVLLVNQIRTDVSIMFGNPETKPGGKSLAFAATTETRFYTSKPKYDKKAKTTFLVECKFKNKKNKQYQPHHEGSYCIVTASSDTKPKGSVSDEDRILSDLKYTELGQRGGSGGATWTVMDRSFGNQDEIIEALETDRAWKRKVCRALIEIRTS